MTVLTQSMDEQLILNQDIIANFDILRMLGRGGEGNVFLVRDRSTDQKRVLKIFYKPMRGPLIQGLRTYEEKVVPNDYGLPTITLLEEPDRIIGVHYPFIPLHKLHWRLFFSNAIRLALFGTYCRMQNYLLSHFGIMLADTTAENFMFAKDGSFHYVDYGRGITLTSYDKYVNRGEFGYTFAMMLLSLFNINIKHEVLPEAGYSYDRPCVYCMDSRLDAVAERADWIKEIISEVRNRKASIFLEPDYYRQLSQRLPEYVPFPFLFILANKFLLNVQSMRSKK